MTCASLEFRVLGIYEEALKREGNVLIRRGECDCALGIRDQPTMMTPASILAFVRAEPFLPFRIHMTSGRTFDIRHSEMIKILKSNAIVFKSTSDTPEFPDDWESISLMLTESISHA